MKKICYALVAIIGVPFLANCKGTQTLEDYSWAQISEIAKSGKASEHFKIGDTKRLQLKHQDLNDDGVINSDEVCQTVRIIGFNQDIDIEENPIGITFEFVDYLSDEDGCSLATYWNNVAPSDLNDDRLSYAFTTIRTALNGSKDANEGINWFEKDSKTFSETYTDSVLDMLPNDLVNVLIAPRKYASNYVPDYDDPYQTYHWVDETVNDSLFLLSPREMGFYADGQETSTFTYSYYQNATDQTRIKHQINIDETIQNPTKVQDGKFTGNKYSYAGYNFHDPEETYTYDDNFGGYSWLRSPNTTVRNNSAWRLAPGGFFISTLGYGSACPVAPAFCL